MEQFTPKTITLLLLVGIVIYLAVRGFKHYCDRVDAEWAAKNPPVPDQKEIAAVHVAKILPASLRTPLPVVRKAENEVNHIPIVQSRLSKREMKAAFHGEPAGWKGIADAAIRKAVESGDLINNPRYALHGVQSSRRYATVAESEGGHHD